MGVELYGSPQSRSPLVNWYLVDNKIPFTMKAPRPSNHPFGQIPFLTDDNGVEVFESGAILLYLADAYGAKQSGSAATRNMPNKPQPQTEKAQNELNRSRSNRAE